MLGSQPPKGIPDPRNPKGMQALRIAWGGQLRGGRERGRRAHHAKRFPPFLGRDPSLDAFGSGANRGRAAPEPGLQPPTQHETHLPPSPFCADPPRCEARKGSSLRSSSGHVQPRGAERMRGLGGRLGSGRAGRSPAPSARCLTALLRRRRATPRAARPGGEGRSPARPPPDRTAAPPPPLPPLGPGCGGCWSGVCGRARPRGGLGCRARARRGLPGAAPGAAGPPPPLAPPGGPEWGEGEEEGPPRCCPPAAPPPRPPAATGAASRPTRR